MTIKIYEIFKRDNSGILIENYYHVKFKYSDTFDYFIYFIFEDSLGDLLHLQTSEVNCKEELLIRDNCYVAKFEYIDYDRGIFNFIYNTTLRIKL